MYVCIELPRTIGKCNEITQVSIDFCEIGSAFMNALQLIEVTSRAGCVHLMLVVLMV